MRLVLTLATCCLGFVAAVLADDDVDKKYPLDPQLKVLAGDVESPEYRKLVTQKMLVTDLAAEWQRVQTADNPESFLKKHGGKDKVFADPDLKRAYERRVAIRNQFLDLMREGYKRYNQVPPFDKGASAEEAGTLVKDLKAGRVPLAPVLPAPGAEDQWPCFRGPTGQGNTTAKALPVRWDKDGTNVAWRLRVAGSGNSSPIVWGDRLFVTSWSAKGEERFLRCYRKSDNGMTLAWSRPAPAAKPEPGSRDKNGYASATPVTDGERVVAFFGSAGLVCFDSEGKQLWHYGELRFDISHGTGSSPLLYNDRVIFIHDQNRAESVFVALDKRTGQKLWSQRRGKAMTWSTPIAVHVGDHDEVIFSGGETVKGYDPLTGKELWTLSGPTYEVIPTVVVGKDLIYAASGRNGPTLGVRPGGTGDVTPTHLVWRAVRNGPHVPSPIYVSGRLFTVNDTGVATCLDAETGRLIWQQRIYDTFSASPVEAGGLLYVCAESGNTYVLRAADRYELVAKNDLGALILASPAVAWGQLILRTQEEMVGIGTGVQP
jgi:outer membrane protein assembly factor BamB